MYQNYLDQYERMKNFFERMRTATQFEDYEDYMMAFFQNCWHLKDWIKNDTDICASVSGNIEDIVKEFTALNICADLANRTKHLSLTRNIRVNADIIGRNATVNIPPAEVYINCTKEKKLDSNTDRVQYDSTISLANGRSFIASELAKEALEAWEIILKKYTLI